MTRKELLRRLRSEREYLASNYGLVKIDAVDGSAIDIVAEFDKPIGFGFIDFNEHLEKVLGVETDMLTFDGVQTTLRIQGSGEHHVPARSSRTIPTA